MIKTRQAIFCRGAEGSISTDIDWDFSNDKTQEHIHSLHSYPARFIPQIPALAIQKWSKQGDAVLDPFCGCGTTLVESILLGRNAVGVDNNPIAVLVSKAKTADYTRQDIQTLSDFCLKIKSLSKFNTHHKIVPQYENLHYWFSEYAIDELGSIRGAIEQLQEPSKTFALAVYSSIIVRVSYQNSDTRYAKINRVYTSGDARKLYSKKLENSIARLNMVFDKKKALSAVHLGDGRNLGMLSNQSVNLIVTSPPYMNAYDYHKYHRHRIHWTGGNPFLARDTEIGKHDYFTRLNANPQQYFKDMSLCFSEWRRVLKPKGKAVIVVGDAIVNKEQVPVGTMFVKIMETAGFECEARWIRNLNVNRKSFNRSSRIKQEHVLLFSVI